MPSHEHSYRDINYWSDMKVSYGNNYYVLCRDDTNNFFYMCKSNSEGGSQAHNNMPPYITAYCWRRYQ